MEREGCVAFVGAGFSSAVISRALAEAGIECHIYEARQHLAGNCYTERCSETGVLLHKYGPHIFHTDDEEVWNYVNQFAEFEPYVNRVKAKVRDEVYSLPINLHTINQFFRKSFSPSEAKEFIESIARCDISEPVSFEEQALKFLGDELYEAFFKGYTEKQWGEDPKQIPASILKRLPVRFNYNDNYFSHKYQGMPKNGYTALIEAIFDHPLISVSLGESVSAHDVSEYSHVFWSAPLDAYFNYDQGRLAYRTLRFERETHHGDFQGTAVMNYPDKAVPFTRITEHKHFSPWEEHEKTVIFREYSSECGVDDTPYYPIHLTGRDAVLEAYEERAKKESTVTFVGRLGTYRYLDMDVTVRQALDAARQFLHARLGS